MIDSVFESYLFQREQLRQAIRNSRVSQCLTRHVGCQVVLRDGRTVGSCNMPPKNQPTCAEVGACLLRTDGKKLRCVRTVHAEAMAIVVASNYGWSLEEATFYQTKAPCIYCANMMAALGVGRVFFVEPNSTLPDLGRNPFETMKIYQVPHDLVTTLSLPIDIIDGLQVPQGDGGMV